METDYIVDDSLATLEYLDEIANMTEEEFLEHIEQLETQESNPNNSEE